MILRKPFAILIKYFRLIHIVLTVLSFYLVYRTNLLLSFFSEYMATHNSVIGKDLTGELFNPLIYVSIFAIIVGTIIILGLMLFKKKQVKLYIYNIVTYVFVIVIYSVANSILSSLEVELVDVRSLKMIQDLLTTSFILQVISLIIVAIRATGFNIKKFDFATDLKELEIEDVDNEEFEVNIDLNSDETRRKINRMLRHAKYIYKENKYVILGLVLLTIGITFITIYLNVGVYNKTYKKDEAFSTNFFTMQLGETYTSSKDYKGNTLSKEETFLMVHMNLKNNTIKDRTFDTARLALKIDEHYFYHEKIYAEKMFDIGNIYMEQNVPNEFTDYVFIYKIPAKFIDNNIRLIYTDYNNKQVQMKVDPISLDIEKVETVYNIGEEIDLKDSIFETKKMKIDSLLLSYAYKVDYNYCINDTCYPSYEYIKPTYTGSENKILLNIKGLVFDSKTEKTENLYTYINNFGKIHYQIGGKDKVVKINLKEIKPTKTTLTNEYFIETSSELINADSIQLVFNIRNRVYKYIVK